MRKFITIALLSYVIAHTFYFIYTITHVSYTRRELSKRELSDGPLVLKEGVVAKRGKVIGRKRKGKDIKKKKKIVKGSVVKPVKVMKPKIKQELELDSDFLKKFTEKAVSIFEKNGLMYFTLVNGAFERLTMNWLCNVADFDVGSHLVYRELQLCKS
ncbi:hypothetical protein OESDEN_10797 [Oesophagostomum dentatum]|uniref:Uncharacterized protein n=1 Tax=Oesophagostomum dentatum TaxID=61180 RepID=A0A0B1SZN5_OESDE|nr:hypothetical protein OESDEN_10797 [Oesophagostomum dentatum]